MNICSRQYNGQTKFKMQFVTASFYIYYVYARCMWRPDLKNTVTTNKKADINCPDIVRLIVESLDS
jgi:hypothetical protein